MKNARIVFLILIVISLAFASLACVTGGGGGGDGSDSGSDTSQPDGPSADDITATYGAEMFHAQLTAMAIQSQTTPVVVLP